MGQGKAVNYTDIVRKLQGPTSILVREKQNFFDISVKKSLKSKQSEASTLFLCPQEGCSASFQSFESVQQQHDTKHETKTSQESVYDQLRREWVVEFTTLLSENRSRAKSGISSVSPSSLPIGWALQKPRAGGTRYSSQVKDY